MRALPLGFVCGVVLMGLVQAVLFSALVSTKRKEINDGWRPVPTLVATRDIAAGETIESEALAEASFPEQFVNRSCVPAADRQLVVGRQVHLAVAAGDALRWTAFAERGRRSGAIEACTKAIATAVEHAAAQARDEALKEFSKRADLAQPLGEARPMEAGGVQEVQVAVVTRDVEEGAVLDAGALATFSIPGRLATSSLVAAADLPSVVGAVTLVPLVAGDPLLWQTLDAPGGSATLLGCQALLWRARESAEREAARKHAALFFEARSREEQP